jgi:excisionase family DNA binding protein
MESDEAPAIQRRTVDAREASQILGVSRLTIYKMAKSGQLHTIKLGNRVLVPIARLKQLLGEADDAA